MGKTRGVHETTPEIRNRMVGMYEAGLGLREIAVALNCSQRTVKRWLNRFHKEGSVATRDRCGRKRATTEEQDEAIIRLATQTPITAAKAVLPALGLRCSVDTVRERLHRAGIHNWSPSKKHIQKIPIAVADGAEIQQPVWRPTGTHLGKKKLAKETTKEKNNKSQPKKKTASQKRKQVIDDDREPEQIIDQPQEQQTFSFNSTSDQTRLNNEVPPLPQPLLTQPPLPSPPSHPGIPTIPNHYSQALNLIPQPQPIYHHHPGLNVSQNWPLDLGQSHHHYTQSQPLSQIHHEPLPIPFQTHPQLHDSLNLNQPIQDQIHSTMHSHENLIQQKVDHQELSNLSQGKISESQDAIINVCSDVCSNNSSNENSQNLSIGDEASSDSACDTNKEKRIRKRKKKKGGKVKGTLETSVEIRNRMIGMSEAGLSTLSIALALNRSERTVKRWLDRWHKEGNVQTKERKGRRRITTREQDEAIVAMATQSPLTAAKHVVPALGLKCSVDTIRERLHKAGIHSWKLGKKQGEGNAVHTVHLWQPSGNRSNKVRTDREKKKKSPNKKRIQNSEDNCKPPSNNKERVDARKTIVSSENMSNIVPEVANVQFQNHSQTPPMMHIPTPLVHDLHLQAPPPVCSQLPVEPQALQAMGPIMQQRSDCRLALSTIVPPIPSHQANTNISTYPSCMMGTNSHTGHMEQADPMNYESSYIWHFQ